MPRPVPLFILFGIIIVLLLAIFVFVPKPEPVFDVKTEFKTLEVNAGSSLEFRTLIINPEQVTTNVTILHELVLDNTLIGQKRVAVKVEKTQEFSQSFPIASTVKSTKYVLRTTAYFDDVRAEFEANVTVLPAESKEAVGMEKPVLEEIGVTIPEEKLPVEILLEETGPQIPRPPAAKKPQVRLITTETKEGCKEIANVRSRDFCYAQFVSDPSVCELIESDDLKSWCGMIAELRVS